MTAPAGTPSLLADSRRLYADAIAFARALPFFFLIPVLIEFAQHVVEIQIRLYMRGSGAAVAMDPRRLSLGFAKTLALILPTYWFVRYMAWDRDAARARRFDTPAFPLFLILFAIRAVMQWLSLFGPPADVLLGLDPAIGNYVRIALLIGQSVLSIYLTAWFVAWPLGNARIGPLRSIAVMAGGFWRAVAFLLIGTIPLMILHYALGWGAIGRPVPVVWVMMALDAIVVGFLALTMAGGMYLGARRAADRNRVALIPR